MMIPATLALLVTLALPAPAENGDASFANALGDIQISSLRMAQDQKAAPKKRRNKAKPPVAAPVPPSASDAVWQKIIEAVKKDGKYKAGTVLMPGSFTLEDVSGDPKADHTKRTVTFLGMLNDEEQFEAMGVMIVCMKHTLDAKTGNFIVDMWMFETDVYGEVNDSVHMTGSMTPAGKPVAPSPTPEVLAAGDAKIKTAYDAETKFWSERSPK